MVVRSKHASNGWPMLWAICYTPIVADFQQQDHVVHIPSIFAFEVHIKQNIFGSKYYGIAMCRHNGSNNIFRFDLDKQAATQLQKEHIQKEYFRDPSIQQYN
jgi:hypothetical protein